MEHAKWQNEGNISFMWKTIAQNYVIHHHESPSSMRKWTMKQNHLGCSGFFLFWRLKGKLFKPSVRINFSLVLLMGWEGKCYQFWAIRKDSIEIFKYKNTFESVELNCSLKEMPSLQKCKKLHTVWSLCFPC